jgi:hypothetical protein
MTAPISSIWPGLTIQKAKALREGLFRMGEVDPDINMEQAAAVCLTESILEDLKQLHEDIQEAERER